MHGSIHEICSKKPVALNIILRTFKKGFTPTSFPAFAYMTVIASLRNREAFFCIKDTSPCQRKAWVGYNIEQTFLYFEALYPAGTT